MSHSDPPGSKAAGLRCSWIPRCPGPHKFDRGATCRRTEDRPVARASRRLPGDISSQGVSTCATRQSTRRSGAVTHEDSSVLARAIIAAGQRMNPATEPPSWGSMGPGSSSWPVCPDCPLGGFPLSGRGRYPERAGVGGTAAGVVRPVEAGQAAGSGGWRYGDVAVTGMHNQGGPGRAAGAAVRRCAGHRDSAGGRGRVPVSLATSATSSSA
jgi:hypothetical protein